MNDMSTPEWWRSAVIYQIYPRSFADSDGDGMGDLGGVIEHLDHLVALGVDAIWLSPFYPSPQNDAGYDVADYCDVDPRFGTLGQFDTLVERAHASGLRVIVDIVPNHTSSEHPWFREAVEAGPGSPERARYIVRDEPVNDWKSVFGGPAWSRMSDFGADDDQWFLHLFDATQPDLDWINEEVRAEFRRILGFWLRRGVDGFRVDVAHGLVKDLTGSDDHASSMLGANVDAETKRPMWDQDGVHEIYRTWHHVLGSYDGDRMMVAEAWVLDPARVALYVRPDEFHQTFNFQFLSARWDAKVLREVIYDTMDATLAVGAPMTWVLSNHDVIRHATRLALPPGQERRNGLGPDHPQPDANVGLRRARAATLLMLGLPGSAYLYQGEELGLPEHTMLPADVRQDPTFHRTGGEELGRDGCRVPLPWEADQPGFGFGPTGRTWLPQPASFAAHAADVQKERADSTLNMYRSALAIRRELDLGNGALEWLEMRDGVLAFRNGDTTVIANTGDDPVPLPDEIEVLIASGEVSADIPADTTVWMSRSAV